MCPRRHRPPPLRGRVMLKRTDYPPEWLDTDEAIRFLELLRPSGPWCLTAVYPDDDVPRVAGDSRKRTAVTLVARSADEAREFIEARNGFANLHFTANPLHWDAVTDKPGQKHLAAVEFVHIDVDADKDTAEGMPVLEAIEAGKAEAVKQLTSFTHPGAPLAIIDSGGGCQALWRLEHPIAVASLADIETAKTVNLGLVGELGGDRACVNPVHLLRLPGTANIPGEAKRKRGRVPAPARLVWTDPERRTWPVESFERGEVEASADADYDIVPESIESLDELQRDYGFPASTIEAIEGGRVEGQILAGDDTRSGWAFQIAKELVLAGVPDEIIAGILLDERFEISASALDRRDPTREAVRTTARARASVEGWEERQQAEREQDIKMLAAEAEEVTTSQLDEPNYQKNWADVADVDAAEIPKTPWLLRGLLLYRAITLLAGKGGAGKSLLAWEIAIAVALGIAFGCWDAPERKRQVLVLSGEDDVDEIRRRVLVACQVMGVDQDDLKGRFHVRKTPDIKLVARDPNTNALTLTQLWKEVRWMIQHRDIGLLVIDPAMKASQGFDESSNDDMDLVQRAVRALTKGADCAVLLNDHARKGDGGGRDATRGASSKVDDARVACELRPLTDAEYKASNTTRPQEGLVLFRTVKSNYGAPSGKLVFEFVERDVGNGETRVALAYRSASQLAESFLDPDTWQYRDAFLQLVADGRPEGDRKGWPWCSSEKASKGARLTSAVAARFEMSEEMAREWVEAFNVANFIYEDSWTSPTRNKTKVWRIAVTEDVPAHETEGWDE